MEISEFLELCWASFDAYGLTEKGWTVVFNDKIYRTLGQCCYGDKVIVISEKLLEQGSKEEILDTLLHKISHAIVGFEHAHGPVWQRKCIELGANPTATSKCCIKRKAKPLCLTHS